MIISSLKFVFPQFTTWSSFHVSFFHGLRWTQQIGRLLIFGSSIAQLGKALVKSANAEAMGLKPIEAPKLFPV